jgi:predicted Kef-type K+ transport protein
MQPLGAWQAIGVVTQFGVTCAVAVWLGYFLGNWLDSRLGTGIVFSLIGALLGMISAVTSTVAILRKMQQRPPLGRE